ncbi:MAG TPA: hypothetical protein DCL75_11385 [Ktedonobacter sp.]|nr:hypothetical protein [Ktedonobacter sp.]
MTDEERERSQKKFLITFAKNANVLLSAKTAKVHRSTVYEWLEKSEEFSILYHQAEMDANDAVRAEIDRRGRQGWLEPVYQGGAKVGTIRKYSDTLLVFLARSRMPEYRDASKLSIDAQVNATTTTKNAGEVLLDLRSASSAQLAALKQIALELKKNEQ